MFFQWTWAQDEKFLAQHSLCSVFVVVAVYSQTVKCILVHICMVGFARFCFWIVYVRVVISWLVEVLYDAWQLVVYFFKIVYDVFHAFICLRYILFFFLIINGFLISNLVFCFSFWLLVDFILLLFNFILLWFFFLLYDWTVLIILNLFSWKPFKKGLAVV